MEKSEGGFFMDICKYSKNEVINGIKHEKCINEERCSSKSKESKSVPCMGKSCGKFEERSDKQEEAKE